MTKTNMNTNITDHSMYTLTDEAYFREKGYSDEDILAVWDRDLAAGHEPCHHGDIPDVIGGTCPSDRPSDVAGLRDAIRENLSPEAVAVIVAWLQPAHVADAGVNQEVGWFRGMLMDTLGSDERFAQLLNELGL